MKLIKCTGKGILDPGYYRLEFVYVLHETGLILKSTNFYKEKEL